MCSGQCPLQGGMSESRVTREKAMMVLEEVVRAVSLAASEVLRLDIQ